VTNSKSRTLAHTHQPSLRKLKELGAIAGIKDPHPHQGWHTVATEMVTRGMDPLLARQITRHKSEKSFERYSQRSLQKQAEAQFLGLMGEE
jgi:integrase/recombinase XerD